MANYKKNLYSVAIDGQGYLLSNLPKEPGRKMGQATILGTYPTQIDLSYKDSSVFLPWAQTDWAGGFQDEKWLDNAKFKYGSGLEYLLHYGQLTLLNDLTPSILTEDGYTLGSWQLYNDTLVLGFSHPTLAILGYLDTSDTWTAITTGWSYITDINDSDEFQGKVYLALKRSSGTEKCLQTFDGSALADATGDATDTSEWRMVKKVGLRLFASNFNSADNGDRLLYSDNGGTNWSSIITATGKNRKITQGVENIGNLYFLIEDGQSTELWRVNGLIPSIIYRWEELQEPQIGKWLGKVYISGKEKGKVKIYQWDGARLIGIFEERLDNLSVDSKYFVVFNNNLLTYGLVYDGFQTFPNYAFTYSSNKNYPFVVFNNTLYFYGLNGTVATITKLDLTKYQTSGYVVTGEYAANKPAVNKLWHSITLTHKAIATGEEIKIEYSIDNETTWTTIGTSTVGDKETTLYFPDNIISKKIQLKITLSGAGTTTPTLYDFVVRFISLPDYKHKWQLTLDCRDNLILLDGRSVEPKRGAELASLLKEDYYSREIIDFQDIDYAETSLTADLTTTDTSISVSSTANFPEQGRIKIGQEEIIYTGKTATSFTGCVRGARGTKKLSHSAGDMVSNKYSVIITNYAETVPVSPKAKIEETYITIEMVEI